MKNLKNKVVILTGALGLLGKSIAQSLAKEKAIIIMLDIKKNNDIKKVKEYKLIKNNLYYYKCDVTKIKEIKKIAKIVYNKFRKIDILINAAAITDAVEKKTNPEFSKFENFSLKDWSKSININLNSMFLCSQVFGNKMIKQKKSSIINFASTYGMVGPDQKIYMSKNSKHTFFKNPAYPTAKGAVISFSKYLAAYWGKEGVRVNSISPGGIENNQSKEFIRNYSSKTILGRMGRTEDIIGIIKFLCSDESSYITGSNIVVDGGWTAI